jgi:hypothetical protein
MAARERALADLTADAARQRFQHLVSRLGASTSGEQTLLGPYTRLDRRKVDDCEVAAGFFRQEAAGRVALAFGNVPAKALEIFMAHEWKAVACPTLAGATRNFSTLMPTFGKDAVAVVLCRARDLRNIESLPLQTVATLIFSDGSEADRAALLDRVKAGNSRHAVWSGHYQSLIPDASGEHRLLREVLEASDLPPGQPGTLILLDPALIKVRSGAPSAVIRLRKAYSAALDAQSALQDSTADRVDFFKRLQIWLRAWLAAIKALNVRYNVGQFLRHRAADLRELFPGAHRGRLTVWK